MSPLSMANRVWKALHHGAAEQTETGTVATPLVRNGELAMDQSDVDAPPSWDEWLQNLPPVDGWLSTSTWEAQHGRASKGGA